MEQSPNTCSVWYIRLFTVWSQFFLPASFLALPHTPKFLPTQIMCSFPNMPHSNSPMPLAIFSAHLGNSYIFFIVSSVKPCLVSLLYLFIPHRIGHSCSLLSQCHAHISVLPFLLLLCSIVHCLHICYSLRSCLIFIQSKC